MAEDNNQCYMAFVCDSFEVDGTIRDTPRCTFKTGSGGKCATQDIFGRCRSTKAIADRIAKIASGQNN